MLYIHVIIIIAMITEVVWTKRGVFMKIAQTPELIRPISIRGHIIRALTDWGSNKGYSYPRT